VISEIQSQMLFPIHAVGPAGPLPSEAEAVCTLSENGDQLHGVHIPGSAKGTLILGFGGNAWNGSDVAVFLHELYPDADVIAFHYRGYRPSGGRPSAEALLADAPLVHDFATARVKPKRIIVAGFSIGSGIAAGLAGERKLDGLILVTPFDSLKAAASDLYPWLPVGPFFEHEIDAAALLAGNDVPVAVIAGQRDTLIRPPRTDGLRRRLKNLVLDRTISGAGHNDIYQRADFREAMHEALDVLGSSKSRYNQSHPA
jgi:Predicted hydrolases or acyltransferases (alpha/beta hydrolase superfamily)